MKSILIFVAAACLSACAATPAAPIRPALQAVERAEAAYLRGKPYAELLLPYLSPERVARVRLAMARIEQAFAAAHAARTIVEQEAALRTAEAAMRDLPSS